MRNSFRPRVRSHRQTRSRNWRNIESHIRRTGTPKKKKAGFMSVQAQTHAQPIGQRRANRGESPGLDGTAAGEANHSRQGVSLFRQTGMNRAKSLAVSPGLPSRPRHRGTGLSPAERAKRCAWRGITRRSPRQRSPSRADRRRPDRRFGAMGAGSNPSRAGILRRTQNSSRNPTS